MKKIKILFVNDNRAELESIERQVASNSDRWEMIFVDDSSKAIGLTKNRDIDVIVTDIEMDIVSGADLLEMVKEIDDTVIRIVYSSCSDQQKIVSISHLLHRFILKPCSSTMLIRTIENTLFINIALDSDAVRKVILKTASIPTVSDVYSQLMESVDSPDFSLKDASDLISKDVGLTVNVLKQVNYLIPQEVSDIEQAVSLLGLDSVKSIALTTHVFHSVGDIDIPNFNLANLQLLSLGTAFVAKEIAQERGLDKEQVENAFMAGMLHQLGTIIFVDNFPKKYEDVLKRVVNANRPLEAVEINLIGISHSQIGAHLLALWGFAEPVLTAMAFYNEPTIIDGEGDNQKLTEILYISFHIAHSFLLESGIKVLPIASYDYRDDEYLTSHFLIESYEEWRDRYTKQLRSFING